MIEIKSLDELEKEAVDIYQFCNQSISDDMAILPALGSQFLEFYSRCGEMRAQAKVHLNRALKLAYDDNMSKALLMPKVAYNEYVKTCTERELYLYELIERTGQMCIHSVEFIRTLISKNKAEIQYQNFRK